MLGSGTPKKNWKRVIAKLTKKNANLDVGSNEFNRFSVVYDEFNWKYGVRCKRVDDSGRRKHTHTTNTVDHRYYKVFSRPLEILIHPTLAVCRVKSKVKNKKLKMIENQINLPTYGVTIVLRPINVLTRR